MTYIPFGDSAGILIVLADFERTAAVVVDDDEDVFGSAAGGGGERQNCEKQ